MQSSGLKLLFSYFRKILPVMLYAVLLEKFSMKTMFPGILLLLFGIAGHAQQDTALVNRVNEMLRLTQKKDLEKIMDYTYPKLFDIDPRELMIAAMKDVYESDEFSIEMHSVTLITIFPVFVISDTSYAKVKHSMLMRMKYKEPLDTNDMERNKMIVLIL